MSLIGLLIVAITIHIGADKLVAAYRDRTDIIRRSKRGPAKVRGSWDY